MKQRTAMRANEQDPRILGAKTFAAITAVEGLSLSADSKKRVDALLSGTLSPDARPAEVVRAYKGKSGR